MKIIYKCEKCGRKFTNELECLRHEETCAGQQDNSLDWLDKMSEEEYQAMINEYKEAGIKAEGDIITLDGNDSELFRTHRVS